MILFIQNDKSDPPHLVGRWLREIGHEVKIIRAYEGEEIPSAIPSDVRAIIPLGGHMGAYDDDVAPWLPAERELLTRAVDAGVPVLGICLGSQLLAAACGGRVERMAASEIGLSSLMDLEEDLILKAPSGAITTQWHEDHVAELPRGAVRLASSQSCRNQIYRIGGLTYGLQFHPEADASIVRIWESKPDNAFTTFGKKIVSSEVERNESTLESIWKPFIQAWGEAIRES